MGWVGVWLCRGDINEALWWMLGPLLQVSPS